MRTLSHDAFARAPITEFIGRVHGEWHFTEGLHVRRDAPRAGWFIFGRNGEKYGRDSDGRGAYVKCVAWRAETRHGRPLGWRTRREALATLPSAAHDAAMLAAKL